MLLAIAACAQRHGFASTDGGTTDGAGGNDSGGGDGGGGGSGSGSGSAVCTGTTCAASLGSGLGAGKAVVVDSQRNVYVAGNAQGPITFGGHVFTPRSGADGFIASFTADGTYRWARLFSSGLMTPPYSLPNALAIDSDDNIYVAGQGEPVDFGDGHMLTSGASFVASFAADGSFRWATPDPSFAPLGITAAGGHVYTTGLFTQTATWGTSTLPDTDPVYHSYLASFDPTTGAPLWARDLGECSWSQAIAAQGDMVAVVVQVAGTTLFASYTSTNTQQFSREVSIDGTVDTLLIDAAGNFYLTGRKFLFIDDRIAGAPVPGESDFDSFIGEYTASDANGWSWTLVESPAKPIYTWSTVSGAFDPAGNIVVAGNYTNALYAGGTPLGNRSPFGINLYMAGFATSSTPLGAVNPVWTGSSLMSSDLAIDSAGIRWITGDYEGAPDLGDGPLPQTVAAETGFFLLRYAPP